MQIFVVKSYCGSGLYYPLYYIVLSYAQNCLGILPLRIVLYLSG